MTEQYRTRRHNRRDFVRLTASSIVGLGLASCVPSIAPSPSPASTVRSGATATPSTGTASTATVRRGSLRGVSAPTAIARARGYFAEVGIDDQETIFGSGAEMTQAAAGGQIDVGMSSNTAAFYNAIARGVRQPMVLDIMHLEEGNEAYVIAIRPDLADTIKEVSDLRGRRIAQTTPIRQGGPSFVVTQILSENGMSLDDVEWEALRFPDMLSALGSGAIDGACVLEPFVTLGKQDDLLTPWLALGDYVPGFQIAGIVFSEDFINEQTDIARRWTVGYVRGLRDLNDYYKGDLKDVVGPILAEYSGLPPETANQVAPTPMHPDGRLNTESILAAQEQLIEWGTIEQRLPIEQLVDMQFTEHAVRELGPYNG